MRKALLLITTATAIRPTTRRAALGAITTVPTAAVPTTQKTTTPRVLVRRPRRRPGRQGARHRRRAPRLATRCAGRVLEVGAGTGLQASFYAANRDITEVTFVDASRGMLDGLRAKLSNAPLPFKTEVVEADAARLPLSTGAYDCVVDTFGLCVYDEPVAVLRELGASSSAARAASYYWRTRGRATRASARTCRRDGRRVASMAWGAAKPGFRQARAAEGRRRGEGAAVAADPSQDVEPLARQRAFRYLRRDALAPLTSAVAGLG